MCLSIRLSTGLETPFWSSYRPNIYFGFRSQKSNSPLFGILHTSPLNQHVNFYYESSQQQLPTWINRHEHLRHEAEERDNVSKYGYIRNNLEFGQQQIIDSRQNVELTTEFISYNNSIISRMKCSTLPHSNKSEHQSDVSLFWYVALAEKTNQTFQLESNYSKFGIKSAERTSVKVRTWDLNFSENGEITFESLLNSNRIHPKFTTYLFNKRQRSSEQKYTKFYGIKSKTPWDVKPVVREALLKSLNEQFALQQANGGKEPLVGLLPNTMEENANLLVFQYVLTTPFEIDFVVSDRVNLTLERPGALISTFNEQIAQKAQAYDQKFENTFGLKHKSLDLGMKPFNANERYVARSALSNLIGGIGYFYGESFIDIGVRDMMTFTAPMHLVSTTPTRSFFPRGFLWDEGFHQLILSKFDLNMSLKILDSWFSLIDNQGWLAREQILGAESRKRVPFEFQKQSRSIANPPTLVLALAKIVTRLEKSSDQAPKQQVLDLVQKHWQRLLNHTDWYFATQSAHLQAVSKMPNAARNVSSATTFRWHGCGVDHCLASGLDDCPRAPRLTNASDCSTVDFEKRGCEGHVDLHSWMITLTNAISKIAGFCYKQTREDHFHEESKEFEKKSFQLLHRLEILHWNVKESKFCDYSHFNNKLQYNCHDSYISLFPFMLGLLHTDSVQLLHALDEISDSNGLWSEFGIRSLSKKHSLFHKGEDYWRGHIWMNLNYLIVQSLKHYSEATKPANGLSDGQKINYSIMKHLTPISHGMLSSPKGNSELHKRITSLYYRLRKNLIQNVVKEYNRKGYFYEQYHEENGEGRRSQAFTGWTALTLLIMAEEY